MLTDIISEAKNHYLLGIDVLNEESKEIKSSWLICNQYKIR